MKFKEELAAGRAEWKLLTLYQKFEHAVILILTALIAIVVVFAVWNLALKVGDQHHRERIRPDRL